MIYQPDEDRYDGRMPYTLCGNSGLLLPRISLGLWHNFGDVDDQSVAKEMLDETADLTADAKNALEKLIEDAAKASAIEQGREQAVFYRDVIKADMAELREPIDKLEMIVDKDLWPMPSYGDLIFEV